MIPRASGTAAYRVRDVLDHGAQVIGDVKNVGTLSYTNQLRDFASYARTNGYKFQLTVRTTTQLSGPLSREVANGNILLRFLP
jgi:Restriction endonuclease fold toxin 7